MYSDQLRVILMKQFFKNVLKYYHWQVTFYESSCLVACFEDRLRDANNIIEVCRHSPNVWQLTTIL